MDKSEQMDVIQNELLTLNGELAEYRKKNKSSPVFGEGDHDAEIMFIGEAPGKNEAKTGRPFCGASGRMLDSLLKSIGITREEVYITNIVKDRPPDNRDPSKEEIDLYGPILDRQIDIIQPRIIATLGRFSMEYIMNKFGLSSEINIISLAHGKKYEANANYGSVIIVPLYHPAAAIYNQSLKGALLEDFNILKNLC